MAPEQRDPGVPDPRCDVYAAARVLEESLAGVVPAALAPHVARALSPAPTGRPDARAWLEGLLAVQRELAKDGGS
jgi:hypothetical protein